MNLEIIVIFAAATGRTLVLPPNQPLYLLKLDKSRADRGLADFLSLQNPSLQKKLEVITSREFMEREGVGGRMEVKEEKLREGVWSVLDSCVNRAKSKYVSYLDCCDY